MSSPDALYVELTSVELPPDRGSFVLGLLDAGGDIHRIELPAWALHQLMRVLPRLDAALLQARSELGSELIAYPVARWDVGPVASDGSVALSVRTDRGVESAYLFDPAEARALQASLEQALSPPAIPCPAMPADHRQLS